MKNIKLSNLCRFTVIGVATIYNEVSNDYKTNVPVEIDLSVEERMNDMGWSDGFIAKVENVSEIEETGQN